MNPNVCPNCSASHRADAKFCANCGLDLSSPSPSGDLQPGVLLDNRRYQIVKKLGEGGFGAVYLAQDTRLQRECVVKQMLLPDRSQYKTTKAWEDEVNMLRSNFEREARSLITLNTPGHTNIPEIYDFFDDPSGNYLVMKYIEGESLQQRLTRLGQPLPWREAVGLVIQVASALEYMHDTKEKPAPVLHRDIKPDNILVDKSGRVCLVDFGLSKAQPTTAAQQGGTTATGTPGYAPWEQWIQKAVPASDVYSLGATLHHLVTARDPRSVFTRFDLAALHHHHANLPPIRSLDNTLPAALEAAIAAALSNNPQDRPTITQWKTELEKILRPQIPVTGPFQWRDGTLSHQPEELVQPADLYWDEARGYFTNGNWEYWFKNIHHNQTLAQIKAAKVQHKNNDIALDAFLRKVDPTFPSPRLQTNVSSLDFFDVPWQEKRTLDLELRNMGSGWLHGSMTDLPSWVQVSSSEFATHDRQTIKVTVDTDQLSPRPQPYTADLVIDAGNGGKTRVMVTMSVPMPQLDVKQTKLNLGTADQGQTLTGTLTIKNRGGSLFDGQVNSDVAWLTVEPSHFRCQPGQSTQVKVKVTVDFYQLTPRMQPHTANLRVNAGLGGQKEVPVTITVPEPRLAINPHTLDLGSAYQGQTLTGTFTVRNDGQSTFEGQVHCGDRWATISPTRFHCKPGQSQSVEIIANTSQMLIGQHGTSITVHAQAGSWKQAEEITVSVQLSWLKILLRRGAFGLMTLLLFCLSGFMSLLRLSVSALITFLPLCASWLMTFLRLSASGLKAFWQYWASTLDWAAVGLLLGLIGFVVGRPTYFNEFIIYLTDRYISRNIVAFCFSYYTALDIQGICDDIPYTKIIVSISPFFLGGWLGFVLGPMKRKESKDTISEPTTKSKTRHHHKETILEKIGVFLSFVFLCFFWPVLLILLIVWVLLRAWKLNFWGATGGSLSLILGAWLAYIADTWLGFIPSIALAGLGGMILWGGLYYPGRTKRYSWSGGFAVLVFVLAVVGIVNLASQPQYWWLQVHALERLDTHADNWRLRSSSDDTLTLGGNVVFSPDGQMLASVSCSKRDDDNDCMEGIIRLWSVDGELLRRLEEHTSEVRSVTFSPDGQLLASTLTDDTVRLWSVDGQLLHTLEGHTSEVKSVVFSPDGQLLAYASCGKKDDDNDCVGGEIRLWSVDGELLRILEEHTSEVISVTFSPDEQLLASTLKDGPMRLWSVGGQLLHTFSRDTGGVRVFSPDGQMLASISRADMTDVKLWSIDGQLLHTLEGHKSEVISVAFSPDGQTLASASCGKRDDDNDCVAGEIRMWSIDGQLLRTFLERHISEVKSVAFSPNGQLLASVVRDKIWLWSVDGNLLRILRGHTSEVRKVAFSPDSTLLISRGWDGVRLWWVGNDGSSSWTWK